MILANVVGTVVATQRSDEISGAKYLLAELCTQRGEGTGSYMVILDALQAGIGEMVLLSQGSSTRQTAFTKNKPVDALVVGIVDLIEERGMSVYTK